MSGTLNRPVPPGRPRGSQSRSSSMAYPRAKAGESQSTDASPLQTASALPAVNERSADDHEPSNGLGLHDVGEIDSSSTTYEIALEDVEDALRTLTRDDLVLALKRAKEQMDILDARVESNLERNEALESTLSDYATQLEALEMDKSGLQFALTHREERIDELMQEQERMENELYLKGQVTDRLRKQLDESERARADAERRYEDQTMTSDKERQYYVDMEKLLQTQKAKVATSLERAQSSNHTLSKEIDRLQRQMTQQKLDAGVRGASPFRESSPTGDGAENDSTSDRGTGGPSDREAGSEPIGGTDHESQPTAFSIGAEQSLTELSSLRGELSTLQTSHSSLTATMQQLQAELRDVKATNVALRTQNETFVDLLQEKTLSGELVTGSVMLNRKYSTIGDESTTSSETEETTTTETSDADDDDDVPDVPTHKGRKVKGKEGRMQKLAAQASREMLNAPRNLASELERNEPDDSVHRARRRERTRERSEALGSNVEELHKEIWDLRDANQALTLYVTKILDRIIAREGYENVLAIDADQKRTLRNAASTRFREKADHSPSSSSPEKSTTLSPTVGRGFLGLGRMAPSPNKDRSPTTPVANASVAALQASTASANKRSSIDWRSILPRVGGLSTANTATPSSLTSPSQKTTPLAEHSSREARKIRSSEEIEDKDDQEVREEIRRNLLRQGVVLPDNQLRSHKRTSSSLGTFFSRVIGTSDASPAKADANTSIAEESQKEGDESVQATSDDNSSMGSPLTRKELRQRALDLGGTAPNNLTKAPARRSLVDEMRARRSEGSADERSVTTMSNRSTSPESIRK